MYIYNIFDLANKIDTVNYAVKAHKICINIVGSNQMGDETKKIVPREEQKVLWSTPVAIWANKGIVKNKSQGNLSKFKIFIYK